MYTNVMNAQIVLNILFQKSIQSYSGVDPEFQVREEGHLKKLCRAEGDTNILGVFRVKNHDFMPKNLIFFQF